MVERSTAHRRSAWPAHPEENRVDAITREYRFDLPRLTQRLVLATDWLIQDERFSRLPIGYFGANTGAAAALVAAGQMGPRHGFRQ